uniref:Uncharacterized protein n=1 Tax=viral metagenome TaxID=1070528 RepID=A0A6C0IHC9_9ZZZZ
MSFKFTRYLYELEEVKIALMISLLNKSEEALFWAYELYYSGYKEELVSLIWKIYYEFYSSLNPSFEVYLLKKNNIINFNDVKNIANILNSFIIRPYNLDVFMATKIIQNFEIEFDEEDMLNILTLGNHLNISFLILETVEERKMDETLNLIIKHFNKDKDKTKIVTLWNKVKTLSDPKVIILSYIFRFYSEIQNLKTGKNIYIVVNDEDVVLYETIEVDLSHCSEAKREKLIARKILKNAYLYAIDSSNMLNLFKLKRDKLNIREAYYYKWLYYAANSPLWTSRISAFNGVIDNEIQSVEFDDEDKLQAFYLNYGYEPDEQKINVQNKCLEIKEDKDKNWTNFYKKYRGNGIFIVEDEYLDNMDKICC